MFSEDIY